MALTERTTTSSVLLCITGLLKAIGDWINFLVYSLFIIVGGPSRGGR